MRIIERAVELTKMCVKEHLDGEAFNCELEAHQFVITGLMHGETVIFTGTVGGRFLPPNGGDAIQFTNEYAAIDGQGRAVVTLPDTCYSVPGAFGIVITLTSGDHSTVIYAATGFIGIGETPEIVDPGNVINVDAIEAYIDDCLAATASAQQAASFVNSIIAPTYSTGVSYAVGDYCTYEGSMYRCTTATGGAFDPDDWDQVLVGSEFKRVDGDVADLKSEINNIDEIVYSQNTIDLSLLSTMKINIGPSNQKWQSSNNYATYFFAIPTGAKYLRITPNATSGTVLALLKTDDHVINTNPNYATGWERTYITESKVYTVPDDAHYMWVTGTLGGTDYNPSSLVFDVKKNIPDVDSTLTKDGEAANAKTVGDKLSKIIPVSISYSSTSGYYIKYTDGTLVSGENFAYTDYISVDGISKIAYSRVFVPSQYNPQHGIAFYDNSKVFVSGIRSIAKGNKSGYETFIADVPDGAKYVRCTIWNSTFSATYNIDPFFILDKDDYDNTLISKIDDISNELSLTAILHAVPQSEGVQNAILTARQFTDIMWTPVADMPGIIYSNTEFVYKTHKKGCRQKGIPYGSGLPYSEMVGDTISFDAFATAVKNSGSVLYTNSVYTDGAKKACYYGVACSKLVQACWGAPELVDSQQIFNLPGISKIANAGEYTFDDIQLGDGIMNPNVHCTIVTDIIRSAVTLEVVAIEISEAVTPTCRRLLWSKSEFDKHFGSYGLYRYSYIGDAKYRKARYIDLEDGYEGVNDIPIGIRRGSFVNMSTSNSYKADVDNTKWVTLHDIVNGVEQTSQINSAEINIPKSRTGYHEVYPTDANGNRGNSSYYFVYEVSVSGSVSSGSVIVTYSITEGAKPWAIVFNPYNYSFLTEDTGTITAEIPAGMTSCYILFKSDYGTIKSSTISLE